MAEGEDEELQIEVAGESGADEAGEAGEAGSTSSPDPRIAAVDELKEQYEALKRRTEGAEQIKAEALRRASEAEAKAAKASVDARSSIYDSELSKLGAGINAAEAEATAAQEAWAQAMGAGDYGSAALAQRRMQRADLNLARLEDAKASLEYEAKRAPREPAPPADLVEAFIQGRTPRTAAWLRQHTDHILDPAKQRAMERAHYSALGEGLDPDTDDYFAHVESKLGLRESEPAKVPPKKRSVAPPSAPVNGGAGQSTASGPIQVSLTRAEEVAATDGTHTWTYDDPGGKFKKGQPIGKKEFARRKYLQGKAGMHDRTYTDQ